MTPPAAPSDPRTILAQGSMSPRQVLVVALCTLVSAVNGFDILSIGLASPGIAQDWQVDLTMLGLVLSVELVGMAIGSIGLGRLADLIGRRPVLLGSLAVMGLGMFLSTLSRGLLDLSAYRLLTGLGVGGALTAINALAAEVANDRRRDMAVGAVGAGYPVGIIVGSQIATSVFDLTGDWRSVFHLGVIASAVVLVLCALLLPESVGHLVQGGRHDALVTVNEVMAVYGHPEVPALPQVRPEPEHRTIGALLRSRAGRTVALLTAAFFAHMMTFYFVLKWVPKIAANLLVSPSAAGETLVMTNLGGLLGAVTAVALMLRLRPRLLAVGALGLSFLAVVAFGLAGTRAGLLGPISALAGFFLYAGVISLYPMIANSFPTPVRAGTTGIVIGVGRIGSAIGPVLAGSLLGSGRSLATVAAVMGLGSLLGAAGMVALGRRGNGGQRLRTRTVPGPSAA